MARPTLSILMQREAERLEHEALLQPAPPWTDAESTDEARRSRVERAVASYAAFDEIYIARELYPDGYAEPGELHRRIAAATTEAGIDWFFAFRKGGKSVTAKKATAWALLTGRHSIGGTLSQDLLKSGRILRHLRQILVDNPRIASDFDIEVLRDNGDELSIRCVLPGPRVHTFHVGPFSENRSVRGYTELFGRPSILLCDDLENRKSPTGELHVERRRHIVTEAVSSGTDDCSFVGLGNVFAEGTLGHQLAKEKEEGMLDAGWRVTVWPAWHEKYGSGWPARYPAESEAEMRSMLRMSNDDEWHGDGQQKPKAPDGIHFPRNGLAFYSEIPDDARGVVLTDPNLAKKGRGDSTAMISYLFSPTTWNFYVEAVRCRSFSDSNELLDIALSMTRSPYVYALGFDGNVTQESTWENNIKLWCRINKAPFPQVHFHRYNVDLLTKNASAAWKAGRILWPHGIASTEEGRRFVEQTITFAGKKAGLPDDAPDALISAHEMIHALGMAFPQFPDEGDTGPTFVSDLNPF